MPTPMEGMREEMGESENEEQIMFSSCSILLYVIQDTLDSCCDCRNFHLLTLFLSSWRLYKTKRRQSSLGCSLFNPRSFPCWLHFLPASPDLYSGRATALLPILDFSRIAKTKKPIYYAKTQKTTHYTTGLLNLIPPPCALSLPIAPKQN